MFTSQKTCTISVPIVPEAAYNFYWLSFPFIGQFSLVYILRAVILNIFRITCGFWNNIKSHKRLSEIRNKLPEGFSQLISDFIEAGRNFIFDVIFRKTAKNCDTHQWLYKKYCFYQKYSSHDSRGFGTMEEVHCKKTTFISSTLEFDPQPLTLFPA